MSGVMTGVALVGLVRVALLPAGLLVSVHW